MATLARRTLKVFPRFAQRLTAFRACKTASQPTADESDSPSRTEKWHLVSAVCLERYPKITPLKSDVEQRMADLLEKMEFERSTLSDHELLHLEDMERSKKVMSGEEMLLSGESSRITATDLEETWNEQFRLLSKFKRETAADINNDLQSVNRKMDKKLVLVVKKDIGNKEMWMFPQGERLEGESMREAAERTLRENCGSDVRSKFLGNAPCGYWKYKFPKAFRESLNVDGNKLFFFKAEYHQGKLALSEDIQDYKWLTVEELSDYVDPVYYKLCRPFIVDDL